MPVTEKKIMTRLYIMAAAMFLFGVGIMVKLVGLQMVHGDKYKELAMQRTEKMFTIAPNRGNLYSDDGSLLATSVSRYVVRFDAVTVSTENFEKYVGPLSKALSELLGDPAEDYERLFRKARANKNRYARIATNVSYTDYLKIREFPLFNLGPYKGGFVVEQRTVREHPLGKIAERSVGYERIDENGYITRVGLEGAFGQYLRGIEVKTTQAKDR